MTKALLDHLYHIQCLVEGTRLQRLLHRPLKYASGLLFRKLVYPLTKREWQRTASTFWGTPMTVALPAGMDIFLLGAKTHDSELRLARWILAHIKPGVTVADVGAHFGFYTLLAAHLAGEEGKVFAFEASPRVFSVLQNNARTFVQIETMHCAVSNESGELSFYEFPTHYSEYNTLSPEQFEQSDWFQRIPHQKVTVPAIHLDAFFAEKQIQPDFIKIDVEGAEFQVVQGTQALLREHAPMIAMEFLAAERMNAGHRQALELLQTLGYRAHYIDEKGNLQPCMNVEAYLAGRGLDSDNIIFLK